METDRTHDGSPKFCEVATRDAAMKGDNALCLNETSFCIKGEWLTACPPTSLALNPSIPLSEDSFRSLLITSTKGYKSSSFYFLLFLKVEKVPMCKFLLYKRKQKWNVIHDDM